MEVLQSRIIKTAKVKWKDLQFIQQENFKQWVENGDKRLYNSILKYQFIDPFKVWEHDGKLYCLDGKHRYLDLLQVDELYPNAVPELLDATFINCKDMKEAAEMVLVYSSAYANITQQGLFDFVSAYDISFPELKDVVSIPNFSEERFEQKFDMFNINETETDEDQHFGTFDAPMLVKPGDIFQLGEHRIACGSFQDRDLVAELMGHRVARIIFCDPPYNLPANFFTNKDHKRHEDFAMGAGEMSDEEFVGFLSEIMQASKDNSVKGSIHYICMDFRHMWHMTEAGRRIYGTVQPKQVCVWNKDIMANGSFYRAKQELVFVFQNGNAEHLWNKDIVDMTGFYKDNHEMIYIFKNGDNAPHLSHLELKDRIRTNVWNYPSAISTANPDRYELKNHPTPKPVQMVADAILDTTNAKDVVIDWFLGSGTTLIAAEKTDRVFRGTELEPKYVQHIICRYARWCERNEREVVFKHLNGQLELNQILETEPVS